MTERLVRRYLRLFGRPDIVHAQNTIWAGHIARRVCEATRLPYVVTEHSSLFLMGKTPGGARGYIERALKKAARVLAVSSKLAESMKPFVRDREIEIVPNLVDLGFFTIGSPRGETPYVFLAASHLNKNKGVDALVRSFACGFRGDRSTRLHIGGDGPERRSLEALVAELGVGEQVFFLGHLARTGVREAMWGANALVHPSHNETFGIVLIEALATGIPVIATRCGGPEDIVTEELGILVDPGSVEQLAAALRTMRATRRYSSADLRENVARRFGAEAVGRRLEGIYQEAIAAGKTASAGSP
jgi:glycosyltransferase involved in cell wall biosynthesis